MLGSIAKMVSTARDAAGSIVGVRDGTEEPPHSAETLCPDTEIRRYGERLAAETTVDAGEESARNIGFRRLAGYIFGGNHERVKFAMTAPVAQQAVSQHPAEDGGWVIRFFLPEGLVLEALPQPDDPSVRLVRVPAETVAARRFSGSRSPETIATETARLMASLREKGLTPIGAPVAWFYDPPWTVPALRRNEIAVPVG
jgi:hypothetical protein